MTTFNNNINILQKELAELKNRKNEFSSTEDFFDAQTNLFQDMFATLEKDNLALREELQDKIQENERNKERIATTVHDLKVPVTISLLNLELAEYEEDPVEKMNFFIAVRRELEFLVDTIGNTLDVAKAETGQLVFHKHDIDLDELFNNILNRLQILIKDRPCLILVNELPQNLPRLTADRNRFTRVFNNLFSNAIKYTEEGEIAVGGNFDKVSKQLKLYIRDTGSGIEPELLPKIFDFFQGDQTNTDSNGVGLSFVKNVIHALGGKISIESKKNVGTTVFIELPVS